MTKSRAKKKPDTVAKLRITNTPNKRKRKEITDKVTPDPVIKIGEKIMSAAGKHKLKIMKAIDRIDAKDIPGPVAKIINATKKRKAKKTSDPVAKIVLAANKHKDKAVKRLQKGGVVMNRDSVKDLAMKQIADKKRRGRSGDSKEELLG